MSRKFTYPETLWAGTDTSLAVAVEAHEQILAGFMDGKPAGEQPEVPRLFSQQDAVGVVSIKGSLTNNNSPWNKYFGVTSYSEIRSAMIHAAMDPSVKIIMLDVNSGGGAVSGVADTAELIARINRDIKPVHAFTDSAMMSAAYWLGVSAGSVHLSNTALMGSIGVIATHMEYSKQLKAEGVGVNVIRSGEHKALLNSVEPATEKALAQLQSQLDTTYGVFIGHVADSRGTTVANADATMGQGREFVGIQAVGAGAADSVTSYDALISELSAKVLDSAYAKPNNSANYSKGATMTRKALTEQAIAALAAGGVVPTAETIAAATADAEAAAAAAAAAAATAAAAAEAETAAAAAAAATQVTQAQNVTPADPAIVTYLQSQLKASADEVTELKISLAAANSKVSLMEATHNGLLQIAAKSVSNMKVALGMTGVDMTGMSADVLLVEHTATAEKFTNAFKAGGVAAVNTDVEGDKPKATVDPLRAARLAATSFSNK